jgi:hypothetical protein
VLEGLAAILSWPAWDALRSDGDCTAEQAMAVTARTVRALLADAADAGSGSGSGSGSAAS